MLWRKGERGVPGQDRMRSKDPNRALNKADCSLFRVLKQRRKQTVLWGHQVPWSFEMGFWDGVFSVKPSCGNRNFGFDIRSTGRHPLRLRMVPSNKARLSTPPQSLLESPSLTLVQDHSRLRERSLAEFSIVVPLGSLRRSRNAPCLGLEFRGRSTGSSILEPSRSGLTRTSVSGSS